MNHKKYFDTLEQVSGLLFDFRFYGKDLTEKFHPNTPGEIIQMAKDPPEDPEYWKEEQDKIKEVVQWFTDLKWFVPQLLTNLKVAGTFARKQYQEKKTNKK